VSVPLSRVFSDIHFGDHASRVDRLTQLRPLLDGVPHIILNGDTLDTRAGPNPSHTAECHAAVMDFFPRHAATATFLSGNHDADFSSLHHLDLAGGEVFVTHGDIFFDDIVPWSHDAALISRRIAEEMRNVPAALHHDLDHRFDVIRRVAAAIPQRHQSERNRLKFALHFLADTVWPPTRILRVMHAWRVAPRVAAELARRHRPNATFVLCGHTHRPGIWSGHAGITVINTGSFCRPLGGYAVDVFEHELRVRQIDQRGGEFRAGEVVATFPLAAR
jgi:predicted phosphodiesterase